MSGKLTSFRVFEAEPVNCSITYRGCGITARAPGDVGRCRFGLRSIESVPVERRCREYVAG